MAALFSACLRRVVQGWVPRSGNSVSLTFLGRPVRCAVRGTPAGAVGPKTIVSLSGAERLEPSEFEALTDAVRAATSSFGEAAQAAALRSAENGLGSAGVSMADVGGCTDQIRALRDLVVLPLRNPGIFKAAHLDPPRGVLLHGPPGVRGSGRRSWRCPARVVGCVGTGTTVAGERSPTRT